MNDIVKKDDTRFERLYREYLRSGKPGHIEALGMRWAHITDNDEEYFVSVGNQGIDNRYGQSSFR